MMAETRFAPGIELSAMAKVEPPALGDPRDVPFDQYQRYRLTAAVAEAIARSASGPGPLRVLDVGGHHSDFWGRARRPIAEFLPGCATVTLDVATNPLRGYVRGRGDALPFRDRSFDLVCSVDVLEHVPSSARSHLVEELTRASTRAVLLAAPFDHPEVERAERFVTDFVQRTCGYDQGQLREHRDRGLPNLASTCEAFTHRGWHLRVWPYGNLWRWLLMMIDKHAVQALPGSRRLHTRLDRQYNERWFDDDRARPCYRHFICATTRADDPLLAWLEQEYGAAADPARIAPPARIEGVDAIWDLITVHAANQTRQTELEPERRDDQVAELEALRAELLTHLDAVKRENDRLARMLNEVQQSATYRLRAAVRRWWPGAR
jgi:Methyltransferase domain